MSKVDTPLSSKKKSRCSAAPSTDKKWAAVGYEKRPKHRIFLSIDAIGSTKLKATLAAEGSTPDVWANSFLAFLPEVEVVYLRCFCDIVRYHCNTSSCKNPCILREGEHSRAKSFISSRAKVWKYIGDEVVLEAELTCPKFHAALHVLALADTIKHFNKEFANRCAPDNCLRFKGTAWVAGFPVTNIEINLPDPQNNRTVKDFLGPSIDLGFRLSKYASEDRLVVSASLARLIVEGSVLPRQTKFMDRNYPHLPICFGGSVETKGVKGNSHPLLWYPMTENQENMLCRVAEEDLTRFLLDEHFKDVEISPFIFDDSYKNPQYIELYERAVSAQEKIPNSVFFPTKRKSRTPKQKTTSSNIDTKFVDLLQRIPRI